MKKKFDIVISVMENEHGDPFAKHEVIGDIKSHRDEEQIAFAMLQECLRRESYYEIKVKDLVNKGFLESFEKSSGVEKDKIVEELSKSVLVYLHNTSVKLIRDLVRDTFTSTLVKKNDEDD